MNQIVLLVVFPLLMAYAAASDLLTMTIPNRLSVLLVLGFGLLAVLGGMSLHDVLFHAAAGGLVLLATFGCFAMNWIGGGDAKLAAATALWLGFEPLPDYMLTASLAGGLLTLLVLGLRRAPLPAMVTTWPWLSRIHDRRTGVPYGVALAAAALAVYPQSAIWTLALAG